MPENPLPENPPTFGRLVKSVIATLGVDRVWYESIVEIKVKRTVDANALVPGSAGVLDCNPSNLQTSNTVGSTPLTVLPGGPVTAATLAFTGCQ
jgi:hypothetical protein